MSESKQKHIPSRFETEWCPKMLREYLCTQQTFAPDRSTKDEISRLISVLDLHRPIGPNGKHGERHTPTCGCEDVQVMSDEKWVALTPEQVEALDQGVTVRAHRGDVMVQGPLEGLVGEDRPDVWVGEIRVKSPDWIAVRERDVPEPDPQLLLDEVIEILDGAPACDLYSDDELITCGWKSMVVRIRAALRGETS